MPGYENILVNSRLGGAKGLFEIVFKDSYRAGGVVLLDAQKYDKLRQGDANTKVERK